MMDLEWKNGACWPSQQSLIQQTELLKFFWQTSLQLVAKRPSDARQKIRPPYGLILFLACDCYLVLLAWDQAKNHDDHDDDLLSVSLASVLLSRHTSLWRRAET